MQHHSTRRLSLVLLISMLFQILAVPAPGFARDHNNWQSITPRLPVAEPPSHSPKPSIVEPALDTPRPAMPDSVTLPSPRRRTHNNVDPLATLPDFVWPTNSTAPSRPDPLRDLPWQAQEDQPTMTSRSPIDSLPFASQQPAAVIAPATIAQNTTFKLYLPLISYEPGTSARISPIDGGTLVSPDARITIRFAPGAVDAPAVARYTGATPRNVPPSLRSTGPAFDLTAHRQADAVSISRFNAEVTTATVRNTEFNVLQTVYTVTPTVHIDLAYAGAALIGVQEHTLRLYRQDASTGAWRAMPSVVDTAHHRLRATIGQGGRYALFGQPVSIGGLLNQAVGLGITQAASPTLTVVLDPDHGDDDPGGTVTYPAEFAATEKTYNLQVALLVHDRLEACGVAAPMTRTGDDNVTHADRVAQINDPTTTAGATLAFNIVNHSMSLYGTGSGPEAWINPAKPGDRAFGAQVNRRVNEFAELPNTRGVKDANANPTGPIYVALHAGPLFSHSELAFMDNYNDRALMDDAAGMGAIADGVFMAIVDMIGGPSVCTANPGAFQFPAPLSAAERACLRNLGYKNWMRYRGDPVNSETGNHIQQFTDLRVPGLGGMDFVFQRTYNSLDSRDGRFGFGWSSLLDMGLRLANDGSVDVRYADGSGVYFEADGAGFKAGQPGVFDTLTRNGDDFMLSTPNQMFYHFALNGAEARLMKISDRHDNTISFIYAADGRVTQIVDSAGRAFDLTYKEGHVETITDRIGRIWRYDYDDKGDLRAAADANSGVRRFEYIDHEMTKITDPEGILYLQNTYDGAGYVTDQLDASLIPNTFDYSMPGQTTFLDNLSHPTIDYFDDRFRVTKTQDANGETEQFAYDPDYNVVSHTDKRGKSWTYTYDERGNLLTATDPLTHTISYTYNAANDLTSVTDLGGPNDTPRTTTYHYDDGNLSQIDRPDGTHINATYDQHGQLLTLTDANIHTTQFIYDREGNLVEVVDPLLHHTFYGYDLVGRQIKITDANQHIARFEYDNNDNITRIIDPKLQHTDFIYDRNDNLKRMIDRRSGVTSYRYDENLKLIAETDPLSHTTTYDYDAMYNRISATDALSHTTRYHYDALYRMDAVEDALHGITRFGYDPNGNVISTTDALSQTTIFDYDALNRLEQQTDALHGVATFKYDAVGRLIKTVNPRTARTEYFYDLLDRLARLRDALDGETIFGYDAAGNRTSVTDANLHTSTARYDADNHPIELRDAGNHATLLGYDGVGNTTVMTDALQRVTRFTYDPNDNLRTVTDALSGITTLDYDAEDALSARTDANRHITHFAYNLDGLLTKLTEAGGQATQYGYDAAHNLVTRINAKGKTWTTTYDALNRPDSETDPLAHATRYSYDALSRRTILIDANGVKTGYRYDALGRLTAVVQNDLANISPDQQTNVTTSYGYDAAGNLSRITDANGNATNFGYDLLDRVITETNPLDHIWSYGYDKVGNILTRTDAKNQVTHYGYDADDLLIRIGYPDSTAISFGYDAVHNQTSMVDALGRTRNEYDALNRLAQSVNHLGRRVGYTYDPVGNRTSMTYPDGRTLHYEYDATDFERRVTDPDGNVFDVTRDATHNIVKIQNPNQTLAEYDIDAAERLTALRNLNNNREVINTFTYTLDAVGNRTRSVAKYGSGKPVQLTTDYRYDPLYRLTRSDDSEGDFNEYAFDAVGNRTRLTTNYDPTRDRQTGVATTTYTYDAANELLSSMLDAGGATLATHYDYDQNGNRIRRTATAGGPGNAHTQLKTEYAYDFENRLTGVQDFRAPGGAWLPGDETRLTYDGYGRLFRRLHDQHIGGGGQQSVDYVYDGLDPIAEYVTPSPQYVNFYRGLGRILSAHEFKSQQSPAGTLAYYYYDGLGSVSALTKQQGQSLHDYRYSDYGTILDNNSRAADASNFTDPHNHYTYTGQEWDERTELLHFYAREYDPATGTWLQQDPYRGQLRAPATLHRYGYVRGNPATFRDVLGYCWGWAQWACDAAGWLKDTTAGFATGVAHAIAPPAYAPGIDEGDRIDDLIQANAKQKEQEKDNFINKYLIPGIDLFDHTYECADRPSANACGQAIIDGVITYSGIEGIGSLSKLGWNGVRRYVLKEGEQIAVNNFEKVLIKGGEEILYKETEAKGITVYRSINALGEVQYIGITNDLERRAAEQFAGKGIRIAEIPGLNNLSLSDARAVEQVLIEYYGLEKSGGTLINKINSIAKTNPTYAEQLRRGQELLRQTGYPGF